MNKEEKKRRIKEIKKKLEEVEGKDLHNEYEDIINGICKEDLFKYYLNSDILRKIDPIAYKAGYNEYIDKLKSKLKEELRDLVFIK